MTKYIKVISIFMALRRTPPSGGGVPVKLSQNFTVSARGIKEHCYAQARAMK
jgi:hypothetical protein